MQHSAAFCELQHQTPTHLKTSSDPWVSAAGKIVPGFKAFPGSYHLKQTNPIHVKAIIHPAAATEKHLAVFASNLYE
jgi:hypothetical protein